MGHYNTFLWIAGAAIAVAGCSSATEQIAPANSAQRQTVARKTSTGSTKAPKPVPTPSSEVQASSKPKFSPPFPDRVDLFQPPKRAENVRHRGETSEEMVELKGFVNVGEPRVILSIDGVVAPLPAGGERYGVQVISIDPPSVVLQRGRSRWTASLD